MARLSIIVPIFNTEKHLHRCLSSIQNQSFSDFEVILINDGSTDQSENICQIYCNPDPRFHYFYKANGGLASARNLGLSHCIGDFISFVDSDDEIRSDFYSNAMSSAEEHSADVVISGFTRIYNRHSSQYPLSNAFPKNRLLTETEVTDLCILPFFGKTNRSSTPEKLSSSCDKIYRKAFLDGQVFESERVILAEDDVFNLRLYHKKPRIVFTGNFGYLYHENPSSLTSKYNSQDIIRFMEYFKFLERQFPIAQEKETRKSFGKLVFFSLTSLLLRSSPSSTISAIRILVKDDSILALIKDSSKQNRPSEEFLKSAYINRFVILIWVIITSYWILKRCLKSRLPKPAY